MGTFTKSVKAMIDEHLAMHPSYVVAKKRERKFHATIVANAETWLRAHPAPEPHEAEAKIGRASCRERVSRCV